MESQTEQEHELARLIVETLNLEEVEAEEIEHDAPLFGDGLGLDSIDALELALAITQRFDVQIKAEDENMKEAFSTLRRLNAYIAAHSA